MMKSKQFMALNILGGLALLALLLPVTFFPLHARTKPIQQRGDEAVLLTAAPSGSLTARTLLYQPGCYRFRETNRIVCGRFWDMWMNGRIYGDSLFLLGYPLTNERCEKSPTDGKAYKTQWFERVRMEKHPENKQPYDVLFGLLGVAVVGSRHDGPFAPVPKPNNGLRWFSETQHTLGDRTEGGQAIATFWTSQGGLSQFGFPLSQPFIESSKDAGNQQYLVQYFERQRLEYHPENTDPHFRVLLGRLGAEQLNGAEVVPDANCP